jgi:LmbE family N-acetylglucosaminyl deacetylase
MLRRNSRIEIADLLKNGQSSRLVAVVVAHPDDEVIGAGSRLPFLREANFICVTDGAPRNLQDTAAAGFESRNDYARARQEELHAALALAGIGPGQTWQLGLVDQEASLNLVDATLALLKLFQRLQPGWVITHPYEGGHPDHDATAFAVHAAGQLQQAQSGRGPNVIEMACYHNRNGCLAANEFLPGGNDDIAEFVLSGPEREFKQGLFGCHSTQRNVLRWFPIQFERFRAAPQYNFARPPHEGSLYYELFDWGMSGHRWRSLAKEASCELDLKNQPC